MAGTAHRFFWDSDRLFQLLPIWPILNWWRNSPVNPLSLVTLSVDGANPFYCAIHIHLLIWGSAVNCMKYYHYWYNDVISLPVTYAFCIDLSQEVCIHHSHAWNAPSTVHFRIHHFVSTQFCFGANCNKKICFVFCCIGSYSIWKVETFFASQHQAYIYNTYSSIILHYTCTLF